MFPAITRLQRALAREALAAQRELEESLGEVARAHALARLGESVDLDPLVLRVSAALARVQAAGELGGRIELRFASAPIEPEAFASLEDEAPVVPDVIPSVMFEEAVRDLQERDPLGAAQLERMGLEVTDLYGAIVGPDRVAFYPHAFAAAKATSDECAKRVRDRLVSGLARGETTPEVVEALVHDWNWPSSYARTVVRTTYNTATTAGRFREAESVAESGIPVGFRYLAIRDSDVRQGRPQDGGENHLALDGLVARADDPIWRRFSPPGGFACRCTLSPVVGDDVPKGYVQVPAAARFAPGFGSRPDMSTR